VALGNERLTAGAAAVLLILLTVEGVTIVFLRQLMSVHLFVGALLIPPVLLKLGSTGYRFVRYYAGDSVYRAKGPPPALLRALGPFVVVLTLLVFASGIALMVAGPSAKGALLPIHKIGFIVWVAFIGMHVVGHVLELPSAVRADLGRDADVPGRSLRWMLLGVALGGGVGLGAWALSYAGPWLNTFN
jgi:hypothetical protein